MLRHIYRIPSLLGIARAARDISFWQSECGDGLGRAGLESVDVVLTSSDHLLLIISTLTSATRRSARHASSRFVSMTEPSPGLFSRLP